MTVSAGREAIWPDAVTVRAAWDETNDLK